MKKIVLSLAGALAATAFAPEAAAVPAFARQTGMACTACHAQHFPILNSFGRAFKASGYTMMGAQGKVEGDHLSLPDQLNASIVMKIRHQKDNTSNVAGTGPIDTRAQTLSDGVWQFFDEFAFLFGGRIGENVGFLLEGQMINTAPFAASFRMPFAFDMGGAKLSVVPFTTDAFSGQYGYELSSGGVFRANRWAEHRREVSAVQYNADRGLDGGSATGVAFVAQNDMGFINLTKFAASYLGNAALNSNYVRIAATPTVGDWAMVIGAGRTSGSSYTAGGNNRFGGTAPVPAKVLTDQTFFDFQAQGEVAGKELGIYAQHAKAPAAPGAAAVNAAVGNAAKIAAALANNTAGIASENAYNSGANERKAWTIGADYSVLPHVLSVGLAYRNAETGGGAPGAAALGDDAWTVTAVYDLYQNVALHLNHSAYSGSAHIQNANNTVQTRLTTFMLEASW